ncbi:hypothetical protein SAMN04489716_3967 [Actinoplanes derwentensis]|uniref:Uncharacterized protein n=1 Tax=Actinoplanes derwentensis TaxID=113562 RepID=A0A1H2AN78_9ACTN|nr:hypothetical protein SAMN04489716_3967 [Actinoplanes derwentensis]
MPAISSEASRYAAIHCFTTPDPVRIAFRRAAFRRAGLGRVGIGRGGLRAAGLGGFGDRAAFGGGYGGRRLRDSRLFRRLARLPASRRPCSGRVGLSPACGPRADEASRSRSGVPSDVTLIRCRTLQRSRGPGIDHMFPGTFFTARLRQTRPVRPAVSGSGVRRLPGVARSLILRLPDVVRIRGLRLIGRFVTRTAEVRGGGVRSFGDSRAARIIGGLLRLGAGPGTGPEHGLGNATGGRFRHRTVRPRTIA